jgi:hypothetical protein
MPALMACLASSVMLLFATFFAFRKSVAVSGDPQTDKNKNYMHNDTENLKKCKTYKILPKIAFSQMEFCFEILVLCSCKLILMLLTSTCRGCMTEVAKYAMHSYMFLHVYNASMVILSNSTIILYAYFNCHTQ